MAAAYDALDEATKALIADRSAFHSLWYSQGRAGYLPSKKNDKGGYDHYGYHEGEASLRPLVKVHPDTGRPNLLIGRHAHNIEGMEPDESERLLDRLNEWACQPPRVYHHQWSVGDAIVWDNRRLMHRATPFDMTEPRRMWHTPQSPGNAPANSPPTTDSHRRRILNVGQSARLGTKYDAVISGSFGGTEELSRTIGKAVPTMLVAAGSSIAFRPAVINIGGVTLVDHADKRFSRRGFIRRDEVRRHAERLVHAYAVKTPSVDSAAASMSGGNIQKMIIARELSAEPTVLVVSQPTRGVDIGAAEYIHARLVEARDRGAAVLVISEDLDEVLGLADRVVVLFDGTVAGNLDRAECTLDRLGLLMAGASDGSSDAAGTFAQE